MANFKWLLNYFCKKREVVGGGGGGGGIEREPMANSELLFNSFWSISENTCKGFDHIYDSEITPYSILILGHASRIFE